MKPTQFLLPLLTATLLTACEDGDGASGSAPSQPYTDFFSALPTETIHPAENPFNQQKFELGEALFWDPILSGDKNVACASCHHPAFGWADGRALSIGTDGKGLGPDRSGTQITPKHAPTIMNVAFTGLAAGENTDTFVANGYFWDLRVDTLEQQALEPVKNQIEMRGERFSEDQILPEVVSRLAKIPEYIDMFSYAFPDEITSADDINEGHIAKALASFQREVFSPNSRFDEFIAGNESALSNQEITGLNKFINGGCARCHSGPLLADNQLRSDQIVTNFEAVRTPSLRNISKTAPYMHLGDVATLDGAVALYEDRGDLQVTMEDDDVGDISAFLRSLDNDGFYQEIPTRVPSGLPVGGDI
ncbi:cytochrome-c peroxidase [Photobacterium satsumensis]|uniref:cytochrome-c peroxidase n=1 Tax=Photobacterium satsumensis TaxID=2910239 RepID=UPI003D0F482E